MKAGKYIVFLMMFLPALCSRAQNLVPNPSIDLVNNCVLGSGDRPIEGFIQDWYTYDYSSSTVDGFNSCFTNPAYQPSNGGPGYSLPHTGEGMLGMCYIQEIDYHEVASIKLSSPLVKDSAYCVSFWIKNSKIENMDYWVNPVGALFTVDTVTQSDIVNTDPDVYLVINSAVHDWVEVSGYYIALGNETYFNLGYFGQNITKYQSLPYISGTNRVPYYFFDDVSVEMCSKDSILQVILDLPNVYTPNGDSVNDVYTIRSRNIKEMSVIVFNRWGNVVTQYDGLAKVWDGTDDQGDKVSEGVYFIKVIATTTYGEVVSKQQFVHLFR